MYGWDVIDAHWRANHEDVISYEDAWKLISKDKYMKVMLAYCRVKRVGYLMKQFFAC